MHTNTTRATQNATLPRRNRQNPALYQHILSDLAVEADQLKTPVSPTTPTKIRDKNNTKCPIAHQMSYSPTFCRLTPTLRRALNRLVPRRALKSEQNLGKQKSPKHVLRGFIYCLLSESRGAQWTCGNAGSTSRVPDDPACYDGSSW